MSARREKGSELRALRREAAHWVLQLKASDSDDGETGSDRVSREEFLGWLKKSPAHVRAFFESYETDRRLRAAARAGGRAPRVARRARGRPRHGG